MQSCLARRSLELLKVAGDKGYYRNETLTNFFHGWEIRSL
jgi:hypothetical protein